MIPQRSNATAHRRGAGRLRPRRCAPPGRSGRAARRTLHGSSNGKWAARGALAAAALVVSGCQSTASAPGAGEVRKIRAPAAAPTEPSAPAARALGPGELAPLLTAEWALQRGEHDAALDIYNRMAPALRDRGVAARATRIAQFLGRRQSALRHAELWTELDAEAPESHAAYGNELLRHERTLAAFDQAVAMLELDGNPRFLAIVEQARDDPELRGALLARFERALSRRPESVALTLGKAAALLHEPGDPKAAYALVEKALAREPNNLDAMLLDIDAAERARGRAAAVERAERHVDAHPQSVPLHERLGRLLLETDDYERATALFESMLRRDPGHIGARASLGLLYWNTERKADGAEQFRALLRLGQARGIAHYHLGLWAVQAERFEDALEHFRKVTDGHYMSAAAWSAAKLLADSGREREAREHLRALRERAGAPAVAVYLLEVELLESMGREDEASAALEAALASHPHSAQLLYARAVRAERRDDFAAAERDLRAILERDPDNASALNALGYMLTNHSRRYREALELIDRALALMPDSAAVLDSKGWAHFRLGEHSRALSYLRQALAKEADHEIAAHVGEALWALGRRDEAVDVWRKALADNPESDVLRETIERLDIGELRAAPAPERAASSAPP